MSDEFMIETSTIRSVLQTAIHCVKHLLNIFDGRGVNIIYRFLIKWNNNNNNIGIKNYIRNRMDVLGSNVLWNFFIYSEL